MTETNIEEKNIFDVTGKNFSELYEEIDQLIKENETKYFAGFFDGEGCISIDTNTLCLGIAVSSTFHPVLLKLKDRYGGNVYKRDMRKLEESKEKRGIKTKREPKQAWMWGLGDRKDIMAFLKNIEPHLIEKRQQAILAIQFLEKSYFNVKKMSNYEIKKRIQYSDKLKKLKRTETVFEDAGELIIDRNQRTLEW